MKALLVFPEFSPFGFWNYKDVCKLVGAKYPAAPLGLITVAALLPQDWDIRLIDMNTDILRSSDIDWSDLVFISGMLPQQINLLNLIDRVHASGKKVVVGGPDPTSQPEVYQKADYLVLGEAEETIVPFLDDLEKGVKSGSYFPYEQKPDIRQSPIPRFDLLNFDDYLMVGIQFSRGCPFNCEFCDIIELYGRIPRTKTSEQIISELDTLFELGYRGHIDFVDDNLIGHKSDVKQMLRFVKKWSQKNGYPFFFSSEASINIADDENLLNLMEEVDLRYLFIGIESPDDKILKSCQKSQNINRKLRDDLKKIYAHGIIVNGGFILGFDNETKHTARSISDTIQDGNICIAMVGFLYALPNTQLTRRLIKENRLFESANLLDETNSKSIDQTINGLNFSTKRPRGEIVTDFIYILKSIYGPKNYFDRCLHLGFNLRVRRKHRPSFTRRMTTVGAFLKLIVKLGISPQTGYYFWRNIFVLVFSHPSSVEEIVNLMVMYIHFRKQTKYSIKSLIENMKTEGNNGQKCITSDTTGERQGIL